MKISRNIKLNIYFILILLSFVGINQCTKFLSRENILWFSNSQGIESFDGISWGTSKEEVERKIGKTLIREYKPQISDSSTKKEITEFENQYLSQYDWKYLKDVDSKIIEYRISGIKNIFGLDYTHYYLKFYENRLYEISFINGFDNKLNDKGRNILLSKLLNILEHKFGKPISTNYDSGIVKYSKEYVEVKLYVMSFIDKGFLLQTHIKFTPIVDKIKRDISQTN